jgi:hypothetical protein
VRLAAFAVIVLVSTGAAAALLSAQAARASLVLLATAGDYPGETYTAGPSAPAEFVYVTGEPMAIDVSVANWGRALSTLDRSRGEVPTVRLNGGDLPPKDLGPLPTIWRDGVGGSEVVPAASAMSIEPGDALRWRVMLEAGVSQAGVFTVSTEFASVDEMGRPLRRERAEFDIEVRSRTTVLPAELARRRAEWLAAQGARAEAYAATEALAQVYPESVVVHLIRSRLAEAAGDVRLARRELDVALDFMRQDRDILFRRFARPGQIEDLIDSLRP